jgi:hypothetical protein
LHFKISHYLLKASFNPDNQVTLTISDSTDMSVTTSDLYFEVGELTHQDIGQMDFYVRYFEKEVC